MGARSPVAVLLRTLLGVSTGSASGRSRPIREFDERLLRHLGGPWWAPPDLQSGWEHDPRLKSWRHEAIGLFTGLRVGNDPRAALLLPFWEAVAGKAPAHVVVLRHPRVLAGSLASSDQIPTRLGLAIVERYLHQAARVLAGRPVFVTTWDHIQSDPAGSARRLARYLRSRGLDTAAGPFDVDRASLVFNELDERAPPAGLSERQEALWVWWLDRLGAHDRFDGAGRPPESATTEQEFAIERFRARFLLPQPEESPATKDCRVARRRRRSSVRVVIITHNEGDLLADTVVAYKQTLPPGGEIVVVDDQSSDGSPGAVAAEHPDVRILGAPRRLGISAARNLGARGSDADMIVWSDAHCQPAEGWCEPLLEALDDPVVGAVAPAINALGKENLPWGGGFLWRDPSMVMRWLPVRSTSHYPIPFMCGCVIATRPDVFEKTGGFDEGLVVWGMEDSELSLRLWLMGYEVHVAGSSRVRHLFRPRFPYPFELSWMYHNILRVATVHFGPDRLRRAVGHYMRGGGPACVEGMAVLLTSDAAQRRRVIDGVRARDDEWFFRRFDADVFPAGHRADEASMRDMGSRDGAPGADEAVLEVVDANA